MQYVLLLLNKFNVLLKMTTNYLQVTV